MNKLFLIALFALFSSCNFNNEQKHQDSHSDAVNSPKIETYYTCSMHPQVHEKEPGKCPICHMNLTKVEVDHSDHSANDMNTMKDKNARTRLWQCANYPEITSDKEELCPIDQTPMIEKSEEKSAGDVVANLRLTKSQLNHFSPSFFNVTSMNISKKLRLLGNVLQAEDRDSSVSAKIGGRIEKVYIESTGSLIQKDTPVVDIYSPKLITAGEEYIVARKSYQNSKAKEYLDILKRSEERLILWGIRKSQFESWFKAGQVPRNITLYSDNTGIVRKRNAVVGKYFEEGQNLFELSDLSQIWVTLDIYEQDASLVELGQKLILEFAALPGYQVPAAVDFINPVLDEKSHTLKIRTTIENINGKLKPGMIANATLAIEKQGTTLVIPRSSIIDTGKRKVIWQKISEMSFQAKTIQTGFEAEGYVEVLSGLSENEEIVIDGNFLLDAQAQLFGGYTDDSREMKAQGHQH